MPDIFLKFNPEIEGGSENAKFVKFIEVQSFNWGVGNAPPDGKTDPPAVPQVLSLVGRVDRQSPKLFEACAKGSPFATAELNIATEAESQVFYKVLVSDLVISSYQVSGSDGIGDLNESYSLSFRRLENQFRPQRPDGTLEPAITGTFDFGAQGKP